MNEEITGYVFVVLARYLENDKHPGLWEFISSEDSVECAGILFQHLLDVDGATGVCQSIGAQGAGDILLDVLRDRKMRESGTYPEAAQDTLLYEATSHTGLEQSDTAELDNLIVGAMYVAANEMGVWTSELYSEARGVWFEYNAG